MAAGLLFGLNDNDKEDGEQHEPCNTLIKKSAQTIGWEKVLMHLKIPPVGLYLKWL